MRTPAEAHTSTHGRHAWCGPSVLAVAPDGWCGAEPVTGYFFREARHLSLLRLELFGETPVHASTVEAEPTRLEATYLYPPVSARGGGGSGSGGGSRHHGLLERSLDLALVHRVGPGSLEVDAFLTSRWDDDMEVEVRWRLAADFADLMEVTGGDEPIAGEVLTEGDRGGVTFRPRRSDLPLATRVRAYDDREEGAWRWSQDSLTARLRLGKQDTRRLSLRVTPEDRARELTPGDSGEGTDADAAPRLAPLHPADEEVRKAALAEWRDSVTRVAVPGHAATPGDFASRVNHGVDVLGSLALLEGPREEWLAPAAGIPLYPAFFGRDGLTAGWQATAFDQGQMLRAAHAKVCRLQGRQEDPRRDEQPGRIVQQVRRGPRARLGDNPFDRYYGDVASPLMFLISLGQLYAWTGDKEALAGRWASARRTLDWVREHGDRNGDGFIEYLTLSPQGPVHQGWKDSDNAIVDTDGNQVEPPLAMCEVQGYWFAAQQILATLALVLGEVREARRLWRGAKRLRERFDEAFWMDDEGCPALALDADGRPVRSVTSNVGHCLASGILKPERVERTVDRLFQPDLFSGWGIRTLSTKNPAYHPLSYHLGSVWPVENATILLGLRRYGLDGRTQQLATALCDLSAHWRGGLLPECVGGHPRSEGGPVKSGEATVIDGGQLQDAALRHPGAYPPANVPQTWNQSIWPLLVQTLLGLQPAAPLSLLTVDPVLPEWLPELELRNLHVGDARVDLHFHRDDKGRSHFRVLDRTGKLRVIRQPPLNDLGAGLWRRLKALARRS